MSKQSPFFQPSSSRRVGTVGDFGDDIQGLVDSGITIVDNAVATVTSYASGGSSQPANQMNSTSTGGSDPNSSEAECTKQGGRWWAPGTTYNPTGAAVCSFLPPDVASGVDRCEKMGGVYDSHLGNCVPKSVASQPYSQRDLDCFNQGKVYNYLVNRCITPQESIDLENGNAELVCGKNSSISTAGSDFKACRCNEGFDWADSGETLDCVPIKKDASGTTPVKGPGTVKQTMTTPPKKATPPVAAEKATTSGKSSMNWPLIAGAVGIVAVGGAYLYSRSKKGGAGAKGKTMAKGKKR